MRAVGPYTAREAGELSFPKDAVLEIVQADERSGWYTAKHEGRTGRVCGAYLEPVPLRHDPATRMPASSPSRPLSIRLSSQSQQPPTPTRRPVSRVPPQVEGADDYIEPEPLPSFDPSWNWGRITREEATAELLRDGREGSFVLRMSATQEDTYTISVLQAGQVAHLRVLNKEGGFCFAEEEEPVPSIGELIEIKMNQKIKNRINRASEPVETTLLRRPLRAPLSSVKDEGALNLLKIHVGKP